MSDQQQHQPEAAPSYTTQAKEAAVGVMGKAQQAAHSMKETISGSLHTVKELVTGNHDNNPASLQQSDQAFTESADAYASPEQQASGPGLKEKITQTFQTAKETVKEKLGLNQSDQDVDMNQDRQDRERMDTDMDTSESGSTSKSSSKTTSASTSSSQEQRQSSGMREKLHSAKENVKDTLHSAKETVKDKLHMNKEKEPETIQKEERIKSKHQELYESDPLWGFYDRAYHDKKSIWDLGRPQPSFALFLAQQNLSREASVLEVGCGTGEHIMHMASAGHRRCMGLDISDKAIHEAKLRAQARGIGERVQFKKYDVRHLQELGSTFDIVIDVCFGHTIPVDMRQSYADQLRTVLNPGGLLYTFWYAGKNEYKAQDLYHTEETEMTGEKSEAKKTTTTTSKSNDTVILPAGMTGEIVRSLFSADKGWRVDHVVFSEIELLGGKTWPAMILAATFVGPKHSSAIPAKARDSTGLLQGVHTATGEGALEMGKDKEREKQQDIQKDLQQPKDKPIEKQGKQHQ